jgi:hypothetical protein
LHQDSYCLLLALRGWVKVQWIHNFSPVILMVSWCTIIH